MHSFPWDGLDLDIRDLEHPIDPGWFYNALLTVAGVVAGESLSPFLPRRWLRLYWEYVAIILGPSPDLLLDRYFVGKSGRRPGKKHNSCKRGFVMSADLSSLADRSLVEICTGQEQSVYKRVYRLDGGIWYHVAYRQEDRGGLLVGGGEGGEKYVYQHFYPWSLIVGVSHG